MLVTNPPETLDPRYATDAVGLRATRLVHAGLFAVDGETLSPRPMLAESYAWESPSSLRVVLRKNLRFHSGKPLASRDVVATLAAFASPAVGSRHARVVSPILDAEEDGEGAVRIRLRHAHATLLTDLELPVLRADQAAGPPRPDGDLDGLGPFRVTSRTGGVVELAPADTGVFPRPAHGVALRTVRDENARALRLHAGRADVVQNGFSPSLLPTFDGSRGLHVVARPGANLTYLVLRVDRGPLADARLRRAISSAVDRELLARTLFAGHAQAARTLLPEGHWATPDAPAVPRDLEGARARVREAGAEGLRLTLLTSTDRLRGVLARTLAQELAEAGILVDVVPLELGTMLARLGAGDFEVAMLQLPELVEPNVLRVFLHGSSVPPSGSNRGRVRDQALDALLDLGAWTTDMEERRRIYASVEARIRAEALLVPLFHEDQVAVISDRARGFVPGRDGRMLGLAFLP